MYCTVVYTDVVEVVYSLCCNQRITSPPAHHLWLWHRCATCARSWSASCEWVRRCSCVASRCCRRRLCLCLPRRRLSPRPLQLQLQLRVPTRPLRRARASHLWNASARATRTRRTPLGSISSLSVAVFAHSSHCLLCCHCSSSVWLALLVIQLLILLCVLERRRFNQQYWISMLYSLFE